MISTGREAGWEGGNKDPDRHYRAEVFVCQTGQHHQESRDWELTSPTQWGFHTKYVTGQLQLVRASAPAVTVCISVISPLSTASFHLSCPLLWQGGFCFRSSGGLSVYKDTTLTSTAFCPASNITLSLTDRISFPLQLYFCYLQHSS